MSQSHTGFHHKSSPAEGQPQSKVGSASLRQKGYGKPFTTGASPAVSVETAARMVASTASPESNGPPQIYWHAGAVRAPVNKAAGTHRAPQTLGPPASHAAAEQTQGACATFLAWALHSSRLGQRSGRLPAPGVAGGAARSAQGGRFFSQSG